MNGNSFDDMARGGRFKDRLRDRIGRAVVRNQRGGERLRVRLGMMFRARGGLWLGMPAAAIVAFLLCFPLRMIDSPATEALTRGGMAAGVVALCWAIGIWASTGGPHSGEQAGRAGSEETDDADDLLSRWIDRLRQRSALAGRLLGLVLVFAALAAVCAPQLELLFSGGRADGTRPLGHPAQGPRRRGRPASRMAGCAPRIAPPCSAGRTKASPATLFLSLPAVLRRAVCGKVRIFV